jgi:hypothetical protein
VDMPERQRTLRATVEWSTRLLDDAERSLLETTAVFVDGWTIEAAARVSGLAEDRALELTEALVRHSLIQLDRSGRQSRPRMLETVREFVAERLAARPDAAEIERRHADYYRTLAGQADRPLRGPARTSGRNSCRPTRATWPPPCAGTWPTIPRRCRTCSGPCTPGGPCGPPGRSRRWVDQLLPAADSLDSQARAELPWTATVLAGDMGDDPAVLAARQSLGPLLGGIGDSFLRAVTHLADFDSQVHRRLVAAGY